MLKKPLNIYILWHSDFIEGGEYKNHLVSKYYYNSSNSISEGLQVPTYEFTDAKNLKKQFYTDLKSKVKKFALIAFFDEKSISNKQYSNSINSIIKEPKFKNKLKFIPVTFTANFENTIAYKLFGKLNFVKLIKKPKRKNLYNIIPSKIKQHLCIAVTHELCKFLLEVDKKVNTNKIKLFLSHSKQDGEKIAIAIKNFITNKIQLDSFFDVNDIPFGEDFMKAIEAAIDEKNTAMLAILSDTYSSREACRKEILYAKKKNKPIVILNAIKEKEERSFPYGGNVPTIRWKFTKNNIEDIIETLLCEVLRCFYNMEWLKNFATMNSSINDILHSPPELLTLTREHLQKSLQSSKKFVILYPDPPLGDEETKLIFTINPKLQMVTPVTINNLNRKP